MSVEKTVSQHDAPILVTGAMRSGTTYLGRLLTQAPGVTYLHEPFNRSRGIRGVEHWLPYAESQVDPYSRVVDEFMSLSARYRHVEQASPLKNAIRRHAGGRAQWYYWRYRMWNRWFDRMLIKDPLAGFLSGYLHDRYSAHVVVLVRHPGAFYYSHKRLRWDFDFDNLLNQARLMDRFLDAERSTMFEVDAMTYPERIGFLWHCINTVLKALGSRRSRSGRWHVVRHEDLCTIPSDVALGLASKLGIHRDGQIRKALSRMTTGGRAEAPENATHCLVRDSHSLASYWRALVSDNELKEVYRHIDPTLMKRWYA